MRWSWDNNLRGLYDDQAIAAAQESLQVIESGDRWNAGGYMVIGYIQTLRGQFLKAQQTLEVGLNICKEVNYTGTFLHSSGWPVSTDHQEIAVLRNNIREEFADKAWMEGQDLSLE